MGNGVLIGPENDPGGHFLHNRNFFSTNSKLFRGRPETGNESTAECTLCRSSGGAVVSSRISEQRVWGSVPTLWKFFLPFVCSHLWSTHNEWEILADRQCTLLTVTCFRDHINSRFYSLLFSSFQRFRETCKRTSPEMPGWEGQRKNLLRSPGHPSVTAISHFNFHATKISAGNVFSRLLRAT